MQAAAAALTQQFLAWVDEAPRSYADAEAWRRSCPHLSIWEDAISDGLVRFENGSSMQQSRLVLTPRRAGNARQWLIVAGLRPLPDRYPLRLDGPRVLGHTRTNQEHKRPLGPPVWAESLRVSRGLSP